MVSWTNRSAQATQVEVLDLRHFGSADLRPLLDEESAIWLKRLSWDYESSAEMILRYVDAKILPGYAAIERGQLLGYCFFVYEGSKGVIGDVFADPYLGDRRAATERQLLTHVLDTLQQSPGIHRIEAQLLLHDSGTATEPFMQEGFQRYPRIFMSLPLDGRKWTHSHTLSPEFLIRPWQEQDYQPAASLITAAYRGHVDSDINDQYRTVTGSLRFLNNIVRFPGCGTFDPEASFVVVHRQSKTNVGMILCSQVKDDVGHVTQVCLLPEYRNRGFGERLIEATYESLQSRGFSDLTLTVTEANARAVALYERLGFHRRQVFDAFVWEG